LKGRLLLLNVLLLALLLAAGWRLRTKWDESRRREAAIARRQVKPAPAPPVVPVPAGQPATAAAYAEVAEKMLFARDRNPTVVIEAAPPPVMPPLPVAHGVLALGDVRTAILSEKPGAPHRGYRPGEMVGAFKLVAVNPQELTFDWNGEIIVRKLDELLSKEMRSPVVEPAAAAAPAPAEAPKPAVVAGPAAQGPGAELTAEMRACQPGDTTPPGTVLNGMKKIVTKTPFGEACRWEAVK